MSIPRFPDAEVVTVTLLNDLGWACTALPDPEEWPELMPIIAINRIGGGVDRTGITDRALMAVVVIAPTRAQAWDVAGEVRERILTAGCTEVGGILIDTTDEETGTAQDPNLSPDNKFVEQTFWISFRRQ